MIAPSSAFATCALVAAAALFIVPGRRHFRHGHGHRRHPLGHRRHPLGDQQARTVDQRPFAPVDQRSPRGGNIGAGVAVAAVGAACVAVAGGTAGLVLAALCCPAVALALRWLRRRPSVAPADPGLPLALDLVAAALHAGRPVDAALADAAPAVRGATGESLRRVGGLLRLGASPADAWGTLARDGPLGVVAATAARSATSGIRLAAAFERLAAELRAELAAAAAAQAQRAGVTALAPLAACFLPSFVCLGIIPVIVGIARSALGTLP